MQRFTIVLLLSSLAFSLIDCSDSTNYDVPTDPIDYSFVVVGCNRVDNSDTNSKTNPSTANLEQFNRTAADISMLNPKPDYLFFAGDMVFGYADDSLAFARQLIAWESLYEASPLNNSGIKLVTIPGNHESQNASKVSIAYAENTFVRIFSPFILGNNGPNIGGEDSLITDQSRLTYSFNFKDAHFVILNTDAVGRESRVPFNWISSDVSAAKATGIKHIFAIGHKPAFPYNYAKGGDNGLNIFEWNRDKFWTILENNQADAMFSAHNHLYRRLKPNRTSMIIAGNGGSTLETTDVKNSEQYFGFTIVTILKSGKVIVKSMGRDVPSAGYLATASSSKYPTTVRDSADITWK